MRYRIALFGLAVMLAACGVGADVAGTSTTSVPSTTATTLASTTSTSAPTTTLTASPGSRLSPQAEEMVEEIREAATENDLERLAELALGGDGGFTASFGLTFNTPEELAAYWSRLQDEGEPITDTILGLLCLPVHTSVAASPTGEERVIFVSPRVMSDQATAEDRRQLEEALGAERVRDWWADGMYLGWRMGIDEAGDWRFFVIGD